MSGMLGGGGGGVGVWGVRVGGKMNLDRGINRMAF